MDERDLREPIVREGKLGERSLDAPINERSPEENGALLHEWMEEWNRDDDLFPEQEEQEYEDQAPQAPRLWYQPDDFQQEEVNAQDAQMREVVGLMLPESDARVEGMEASDLALLPEDEIARLGALALEDEPELDYGLGLGDE